MLKVIKPRIVVVLCLMALVLSSELLVQIWPGVRLLHAGEPRSKLVECLHTRRRDAVKVIKITEAGEEIVPGEYQGVYQMADKLGQPFVSGVDWIKNLSFTVSAVR